MDNKLRKQSIPIRHGGDFDAWDIEIRGGLFGAVRVLMVIEEHGGGKQLLRFRSWARIAPPSVVVFLFFALLSTVAVFDRASIAAAILGLTTLLLGVGALQDCAIATASYLQTLQHVEVGEG